MLRLPACLRGGTDSQLPGTERAHLQAPPREALDSEQAADLLRVWRASVVVQDELGHGCLGL